LALSQKP